MSDTLTLAAETREGVGKGAPRSLRSQGRVPAVRSGQHMAPEAIHPAAKWTAKALHPGHLLPHAFPLPG